MGDLPLKEQDSLLLLKNKQGKTLDSDVLEAVLFAAGDPISAEELASILQTDIFTVGWRFEVLRAAFSSSRAPTCFMLSSALGR